MLHCAAAPENIPAAAEIGDNDVEIIDSTTPENWKFTKKVKDSHYSDMRMVRKVHVIYYVDLWITFGMI